MSFSTVAAAALALLQTAVPIWETHPTLSCMRQVRADCDYVNFVCELWREPAVKPVIVDFNAGEVSGSLWSAGIVGRSEPLHEGNYFSSGILLSDGRTVHFNNWNRKPGETVTAVFLEAASNTTAVERMVCMPS